jgi:hypothetical protein
MSLTVNVNDPAYPPGTELTVAGFRVMFVNGQATTVEDADVDPNLVENAQALLEGVAGFSVNAPVEVSTPPVQQVANVTMPTNSQATPQEGGETQ